MPSTWEGAFGGVISGESYHACSTKLKISHPSHSLCYEELEVTGWGMANPEHVERLKAGVETWNEWRRSNPEIEPDLSGSDLSSNDLSYVEFSYTKLSNVRLNNAEIISANLISASLHGASLSGTDLSGADLRGADLRGANLNNALLIIVTALSTDFRGSSLTGACLEDWNINSDTNLEGVTCEYIYLKRNHKERRPLTGVFKPGDFAKLVQKAVSTVDLIFRDGINWEAFAQSFDQLRAEAGTDDLAIQAIENKSDDSFVIRVNTPLGADNAKIQQFLEQEYQKRLKVIEDRYRVQLQAKDEQLDAYRQQNTDLIAITKLLASKPPSVTQNIGAAYGVSGHTEGDQNIHPHQKP